MRSIPHSTLRRTSSSSSFKSFQVTLSSVKRGGAMMNRLDLVLLLGVLLPLTVYLEFYAHAHVQPVDLNNPSLRKPVLPSLVSSRAVLFLSFVLPPIVHFVVLRKRIAIVTFVLGLTHANFLTLFATNALKVIVGRPRPFFATVCRAYNPSDSMICTNPDLKLIDDARRSFPSGHSSLAFSAATFLALCLLKTFLPLTYGLNHGNPNAGSNAANANSRLAPALSILAPLAVATLVAISRLVDFHHHYSDVVAGSSLGALLGALSFAVHFYPNFIDQPHTHEDPSYINDAHQAQDSATSMDIEQVPV